MVKTGKVLFITNGAYIDFDIAGGVQQCTLEFLDYFKKAKYDVKLYKFKPKISLLSRIKLKLGIEAYELYQPDPYLDEICKIINEEGTDIVLFNQINISHWAKKIRQNVSKNLKLIALSHGNESGDYFFEIIEPNKKSWLKTWRLGSLLIKENEIFSSLDGVISISEQESFTNKWIGATSVLYLPRILTPSFINYSPQPDVIGFTGTLDHLPNFRGITLVAEELKLQNFKGILKLVGGPKHLGENMASKYSFIKYCGKLNNDELLAEIKNWSIFINPVFWYARGSSTKLATFINYGIPVLSTMAGARGYDLYSTDFIVGKDSPEIFVKTLLNKLNDTKTLENIAKNNATNFNMNKWIDKLNQFIESL